ncbi:uncharacterized protein PHACADRAFT_210387 [Phanerochaete carnosa HHB-10118-sp]|uniref:Cytochrome P450 n=1 Tax=Phanerochaete carnosa (strain HHB-10118-sp) TaxID=650164 RepID=K5UWY5_PHACS|nr:uncharacterized protein PHACADRAFT_210387 [Phanerochaete carnosa HHB-10118-sp]EKM54591.1 hypothetical protein PHACADRAFT_210387 [Phanerochaete carnosa HHB-10118-sp]
MFQGLIAGLLLLVYFICRAFWKQHRRLAPFPPGPPADPLIGNVRSFPAHDAPLGLMELAKKYGDVMYFNILGKHLVVLSSQEAASDLLEKRSAIYSSRPRSIVHEMIGWDDMLGFLPYGEDFIKQRKFFQQAFSRQGCGAFRPSQLSQARILLKKVLQNPERYEDHIRQFSAAVIMEITYGHRVSSDDDPYIGMAEGMSRIIVESGHSLSIIDFFPSLRYLPSWFPGNWLGRFAKGALSSILFVLLLSMNILLDAAPFLKNIRDVPFEQVRQQMVTGTATPSFTSKQIEELEQNGGASPEDLQILKAAALQMYAAGADTTWSTLMNIVAMLFIYPNVQRQVQDELDSVIGGKRLPDFDDREPLPYLEAVIHETMRWHPTTPFNLPHSSTTDDIYRGMYIPKGTTVLANSTAMSMNDKVYSNPTVFRPERFLSPESEPLPVGIGFGWGRRICPGRLLADASVWIVAASFLTVFEVVPAKDAKGLDINPEIKWLSGITSHPAPFPCVIRPRSGHASQLVTRL